MKHCVLAVLIAAFSLLTQAQTYTFSTLASFGANGPSASSSLIIDSAGNLYGTSYYGGTSNNGTVYKVTPKGAVTVLHNFPATGYHNSIPSNLVRDSSTGTFYGTYTGYGIYKIFKLTSAGKFSVLWNSTSPYTPTNLTISSGNLYTAVDNLNLGVCTWQSGQCLVKVSSKGVATALATFDAGVYGSVGALIARSGTIYGAGVDDLFEWSAQSGFSELYSFNGYPANVIRQDANANLYGTTYWGGTNNYGTVFEFTAEGVFSTLYNFCSQPNCADGGNPGGASNVGNLTLDSAGDIYGTNSAGVFQLTPAGVYGLIYSGPVDCCGLVMDKAGNLYGTGPNANGLESVWKLTKH